MEEEKYVCVAVTYKKYVDLLNEMNGCKYVYPPARCGKTQKQKELMTRIETINGLPVYITEEIDEDMKFLTEAEANRISKIQIAKQTEFMKNYEPDYMWRQEL